MIFPQPQLELRWKNFYRHSFPLSCTMCGAYRRTACENIYSVKKDSVCIRIIILKSTPETSSVTFVFKLAHLATQQKSAVGVLCMCLDSNNVVWPEISEMFRFFCFDLIFYFEPADHGTLSEYVVKSFFLCGERREWEIVGDKCVRLGWS